MIYEVKIKKPDGSLKEVISSDRLEKMYWETFYQNENNIGLVTTPKSQVPTWVKQRLDLNYPDSVNSGS
ncbi:hypothetical protein [Nitrospina watsonii]|uniref:Uncharacterized protein n=1 Tax=Nitrospina watsonii TaxID=1323948 RepID=A0ABN8VUA4_9BACT|nr:hypothetical protein [Nitrospina watsonii]CAI2717273.1 conserved protein of unknown function [Nitrospina watsonii]